MADATNLRCAYCGRENVGPTTHCAGCGTPLEPARPASTPPPLPDPARDAARAAASQRMWRGAILFGVGIFLTMVPYPSAIRIPGGGIFMIALAAVLFGGYQFFQGLIALNGQDPKNATAEALLNEAAHLENEDRAKAITAYREVIRQFPGTGASAEAQRNIETLTTHTGS